MKKLLMMLALTATMLASGPVIAHGDGKPEYGGIVQMVDDLSFELVGTTTGAVIYVDPGAGPGHVIELLQNMSGADAIFQMIKDAGKDWDGSDPLRVLG